MTTSFSDVVVLGAGPAGSATAIFLARRGYQVTLLDRAAFPRVKPCGEYLTPGAVRLLRDELGLLPQMLQQGAAPLTRETIVPHDGRAFGGRTEAVACPRVVTDTILRNAAQAAGVTVVEEVSARRVLFEGDRVIGVAGTQTGGDVEYRTRLTVAADGTHSLLARALGIVHPIPRLQRLALVGHFAGVAGDGQAAVTMHLPADRSDACCGVGAPCGPDGARNVNIVVPTSEASKMAGRREDYFRDRLCRSFPRVWEEFGEAVPAGPLFSVGCFGHHTSRATHDGAVLVGDAATFINPFTGEGVFFALRGGQLAAETIDLALRRGDTSRHQLHSYDRARRRELLPRYRLCDLVQRVVHSPSLLAWAGERLRRSTRLTDVLLSTVGDVASPRDLLSFQTIRLALGAT